MNILLKLDLNSFNDEIKICKNSYTLILHCAENKVVGFFQMPRLYTFLAMTLIASIFTTPEVGAKGSCSYACMKSLFACKRRSEGDCCNKFTDCFLACGLSAPP